MLSLFRKTVSECKSCSNHEHLAFSAWLPPCLFTRILLPSLFCKCNASGKSVVSGRGSSTHLSCTREATVGSNLQTVHCPGNQPRLGILTVPCTHGYLYTKFNWPGCCTDPTGCCYMMYTCHLQGVICIPASATLGSHAAPVDAKALDSGGKILTSAEDRSHHENIH